MLRLLFKLKNTCRVDNTPWLQTGFLPFCGIHLWKYLESSGLSYMTFEVTLMINDVEGIRWNYSLKSRFSAVCASKNKLYPRVGSLNDKGSDWLKMPWTELYLSSYTEGDLKVGMNCLLSYLSVYLHTYRCVAASLHWILLPAQRFRFSSALNFALDEPTGGLDHRSAGSQSSLYCFSSLIAGVVAYS